IPPKGALSDADYLQVLIGKSKLSATEWRNRFRVSFDRGASETISLLQLNVEALLGLLSDTYQSSEEPFNAIPVIADNGKPRMFVISDKLNAAFKKIDAQLYPDAKTILQQVSDELGKMAHDYNSKWLVDKCWWWWSWAAWNDKPAPGKPYPDAWISLKDRARINVENCDQLGTFEKFFDELDYLEWMGSAA